MSFHHKITAFCIILTLTVWPYAGRADEAYLDWYSSAQLDALGIPHANTKKQSLCNGTYWEPPRKNIELTTPTMNAILGGSILGSARSYEYNQDYALLKDDVILQQNNIQLESDQVALDFIHQQATLSGRVHFRAPGFLLLGDTAHFNLDTQETNLPNATYLVHEAEIRGTAKNIHLSPTGVLTINQGNYTGCPPGKDDWHLSGSKIQIDRDAGWGTATNMRLFLGSVPILYIPYFTFPTDSQRHTGLLYPTIYNLGSADFSIPFYWNIAPNYDATIAARNLSDRGILWQTELRFLTPTTGEGRINASRLASDPKHDDQVRDSFSWQQKAFWQDKWALNVDYNSVSDADYLNDFSQSLSTASASQLNRSAQLSYEGEAWRWQAQLQTYQTIDHTVTADEYPYRQLPKLTAENIQSLGHWKNSQLNWKNHWEYIYFAQPSAVENAYVQRAHWETDLNYAWENSWAFFKPEIGLLHTQYLVDQPEGDSQSLRRSLPKFNLDTGLYFQRPFNWRNENYWQTLEPRLFYLYVPYRDQTNIPLLDTSALNFDLDQLYRFNRFSGIDRINDSQRLSLSIGTQVYNSAGESIVTSTIGQIFYEKGLRVELDSSNPDSAKTSSHLLSNTQVQWSDHTRGLLDLEWNQHEHQLENIRTTLQWRPDNWRLVNIGYRYRQANNGLDGLEQAHISFTYPLEDRWHAIGAWAYDLNQHTPMEYLGGVSYETCCWRTALVLRQRLSETDATADLTPLYTTLFTIELKGLSRLGDDLEKTLNESIPGFLTP